MTDENTQRITFSLPLATYNKLSQMAAQRGYRAASGYARAIAEQAVGVVDFTPLSAAGPLLRHVERVILDALRERPKTLSELGAETGKWLSNLQPTLKRMLLVDWVCVEAERYTGGRPAKVYRITEQGLLRFDQELERKKAQSERAEKAAAAMRAESARAHPDFKPEPRLRSLDLTTEDGRFTQVILDAIYAAHPTAKAAKVEPVVLKLVQDAQRIVGAGVSTWEEENATIAQFGLPEGLDL